MLDSHQRDGIKKFSLIRTAPIGSAKFMTSRKRYCDENENFTEVSLSFRLYDFGKY